MKYRILGKTGFEVSVISMGCWGIGVQWGPIEENQAIQTVDSAFDAGVNLFDTADSYGLGQSEFYTGKALKNKRDQVFIATKVGNWGRRIGDPVGLKSIHSIINCCHASLYRLGTDYIDLYQLHWPSRDTPVFGCASFYHNGKNRPMKYVDMGKDTETPTPADGGLAVFERQVLAVKTLLDKGLIKQRLGVRGQAPVELLLSYLLPHTKGRTHRTHTSSPADVPRRMRQH